MVNDLPSMRDDGWGCKGAEEEDDDVDDRRGGLDPPDAHDAVED